MSGAIALCQPCTARLAPPDRRRRRSFPPRWQYKNFNDRILHEALKLATTCNAELDVIYAHDLSSISADEFGFDNASTFFSSSKAKTLFDAQADAFHELAERNGIAPERQHMIMGDPAKVLPATPMPMTLT